ncbi:Hypothetical predicted protein [Pelobates cultripes]|uniref:Uncharacterized protein n=1 Tax=Pelobates cultripes TaxID=61616 RepID=A0AAD1RUG6_PELCU|nr:Hypothetical predicted protein [Pelobates cultripes]
MEGKYCRAVSGFDARLQQRLWDVLHSMEYPIPEDRETEWRVALRTDLWKEDINEIRPFRSEKNLTTDQRQAEQLELWMPFLGDQTSEEWGEDYDGPGLLWEVFEDGMALGDPDSFRFWCIRDEWEDILDLMEIAEMQPDLTFLATRD